MSADSTLQRLWYGRSLGANLLAWLLLPFSAVFALIVGLRRLAYRGGILQTTQVARPVIVVGNISVGGTGKTPFVIWLVHALRAKGFNPGVITRGYRGTSTTWPVVVSTTSDAAIVGDESVLLASRTQTIVVAGPDRVATAQRVIELGADIVVSDDGLQHYRLHRDVEIALIDAERGLGNRMLLPAGPLRERAARLREVDAVVVHRRNSSSKNTVARFDAASVTANSKLGDARSLTTKEQKPLAAFLNQPVHALAAIGNPEAFFAGLRAAGLTIDTRVLPDHAHIRSLDLTYPDRAPVLMTEKDAVKCRAVADARCWAVELVMNLSVEDSERIMALIEFAIRDRKLA
ncbi:MAG: tetraacyldisaccharide 4'-kinase [Candidatus Obscuribacterales bacterium]|nr:tetraacyldisaccharide 4'-kinase [Steroidobacteraceae bacterium]